MTPPLQRGGAFFTMDKHTFELYAGSDQERESMDLLPTPAKKAKFSSEEETATGMKSFFHAIILRVLF